jgi:hypothetical protein
MNKLPRSAGHLSRKSIVDLAIAGMINYGIHPGVLICCIKGKYVGESRYAESIYHDVSSRISKEDATQINKLSHKAVKQNSTLKKTHPTNNLSSGKEINKPCWQI